MITRILLDYRSRLFRNKNTLYKINSLIMLAKELHSNFSLLFFKRQAIVIGFKVFLYTL